MTKHLLPLALLAASLASCDNLNKPSTLNEPGEATEDTAVVYRHGEGPVEAATDAVDADNWQVPVLPDASYEEVKSREVKVQADDQYNVYSADETVFFDTDKAELRPRGKEILTEIARSIKQRSAESQVHVVGHADARDTKSYNKELGMERAEAVKSWLVESGQLDASRIKAMSEGETDPVATNATPEGRQQNRRVEIVVRNR